MNIFSQASRDFELVIEENFTTINSKIDLLIQNSRSTKNNYDFIYKVLCKNIRIQFSRSQKSIIKKLCLFVANPFLDEIYYLKTYKLVDTNFYFSQFRSKISISAEEHYVKYGVCLGKNPSKSFFTTKYLLEHPHLAAIGRNPLVHWGMCHNLI